MNSQEVFLTELFNYLNKNTAYAVLRNYDGLPSHNKSRDIDIVIEKCQYRKIRRGLVSLIERLGWRVVTYLYSDRLITWVCGNLDNDGKTELVQLDFFYHTSVYGVKLLSAKEALKDRKFNGILYHVNIECEFLDKYLYDRAVGATYPEKYQSTRDAVITSHVVNSKILSLFGVENVSACDKNSSRKMLLHALRKQLIKSPFSGTISILSFLYYRIKNYLCSKTGFSIGFTGPDGVGKSTVIDMLIDSFGDVFKEAHSYYHFRPQLFGNLGEVAHSAGLKKEVDKNYEDPHRGGKTGWLNSFLRLCYYTVDYVWGYAVKVKTQTRITRIVIFDRYYTDIICDSHRTRIWLPFRFLYWFGRIFIPQLDYNILLTADTDTILKRKHELSFASVSEIKERMAYLSDKKGFYLIENDTQPEHAISKILEIVFEKQHKKNIKRIL